ncbi:autotransporter assembly complex family protein [Glaciecola sp. KUL10]|uniref:autotransporter assembly complex protein TamA n=1 Tax=Glaciecola sp. (strain KUL10) TaxID=2161813 RepID=UPI000D9C87B4|nr:POTRA domain-containing protein [Glaciecola sp. KUL10]GBL05152.1 outer membrane protein [Glaciecola sp. KUL10]
MSHSIVRADIHIKGVEGELLNSLEIYKKQISFPDNENLTELSVTKYQNELEASLTKGLRAFGYFMPRFEYSSDSLTVWRSDDIDLNVVAGPQATIKHFDFKNDLGFDFKKPLASQFKDKISIPQRLIDQLSNTQSNLLNKPLVSNVYETQKSVLQSIAVSLGYFDFHWVNHEIQVEAKKAKASVIWEIQFGKRYQFGELSFIAEDRGAELVESVKQFKTGDWFSQAELAKFTQRVRQTAYFDSVIVRPNKEKKTFVNNQPQVPIELILKSKPKDAFRFGVGFATDTGARVTTNWQRPWVNLRGHSVSSSMYLSRQEQTFDLGYTVPMANPLNDFLNFNLAQNASVKTKPKVVFIPLLYNANWVLSKKTIGTKSSVLNTSAKTSRKALLSSNKVNY